MPVDLDFLRSSSFCVVHARSAQSVNTSSEISTRLPSGENLKLLTSSASVVFCSAAPPLAPTRQSWLVPSFGARNQMLPSGAQRGLVALSAASVRRTVLPP